MIGDITDRGLSIIDIESKFKTLKAAWIPQIVSSKDTLHVFEIIERFIIFGNSEFKSELRLTILTNLNALDRISNPLSSVNKSVTSRTYKLMIFLNNSF